jgi:hypothetical protein
MIAKIAIVLAAAAAVAAVASFPDVKRYLQIRQM